jgi:hypothetical protein
MLCTRNGRTPDSLVEDKNTDYPLVVKENRNMMMQVVEAGQDVVLMPAGVGGLRNNGTKKWW